MSVSKKPTRSPTGMPFTRKSEIFGLHSIPVGTNPSVLEKPLIQRFFAYKVFFRRTCQRKNEKSGVTAAKTEFRVYRQIEAVQNNCTAEFVKTDFSVTLDVCAKKSLIEKQFNCFFRIPCEVPQAKGFRCI